jgi:hypothetical protein
LQVGWGIHLSLGEGSDSVGCVREMGAEVRSEGLHVELDGVGRVGVVLVIVECFLLAREDNKAERW